MLFLELQRLLQPVAVAFFSMYRTQDAPAVSAKCYICTVRIIDLVD
jgi:hypothetical protein